MRQASKDSNVIKLSFRDGSQSRLYVKGDYLRVQDLILSCKSSDATIDDVMAKLETEGIHAELVRTIELTLF